uniref:Polymer-forming cytoskeletal protein n=1 Tax=uncultured organism TaxID=155900 RepID=M1PUN4_9ZZZZ|nr:hypothetical protein FLSS-1_0012 [uncultured organism]
MSEENRGSVKITGSGTVSGGIYESVRIAGSGTVNGDVRAGTVSCAGSARFKGKLEADELKTTGGCEIDGPVRAGEVKTSGTCTIKGNLSGDLLKCSGSQTVEGNLSTKYVRVQGSLDVAGDVEADKFLSRGTFDIGSLLSADEIEIQLGGECKAREIGGEEIKIDRKGKALDIGDYDIEGNIDRVGDKLDELGDKFGVNIEINSEKLTGEIQKLGEKLQVHLGGSAKGRMEADLIEGDEVSLKWTSAGTVRGKNVKIGEGCRIDRVEYYDSLKIGEDTEIGEKVKL